MRSIFNTPSSVWSVIDLVRFNSGIVDVNESFRCLVLVVALVAAILMHEFPVLQWTAVRTTEKEKESAFLYKTDP